MRTTAAVVLAITGLACSSMRAQCSSAWSGNGGLPGTDDAVNAITTWDPDGAGPAPARLVVGGAFRFAGSQSISRVATFDLATGAWSPLYLGVDAAVGAFATLANGELVVAGSFGGAYGTISGGLVRWNGTSWSGVSGGVSLTCNAVLPLPSGGLIAAGLFGSAGGVPASAIAQWDGSTWSPLGSGLAGPFPVGNALVRLPNGDVIVGGDFTSAGGVPASFAARWNGSTWSAMPGLSMPVKRLALAPVSGDVIALAATQYSSSLQRWNGTSWTQFVALTGYTFPAVTSLDAQANGDLVIGGKFFGVGSTPATNLARFDGTAWHALGNADNPQLPSTAHVAPSGDLFLGGSFTGIGPVVAHSIARWDGANWHGLGVGIGAPVVAQAELPDGRQVVATTEQRVLRRDGAGWTGLGAQLPSGIRALAVLTNGDLLAAGSFTYYTPSTSTQVLRWSGTTWVPFASPLLYGGNFPGVTAMHALPDGGLLVGGYFGSAGGVALNGIARWDGSAWHALPMGSSGIGFGGGVVYAFATLPDGTVAVGGDFTMVGSPSRNVARWDGSNWSVYGAGLPAPFGYGAVTALAVAGNGELIAGGYFTSSGAGTPNYLARWNGSAWVALGTGVDSTVSALLTLPNGDVVAGGGFATAGGVSAVRLARWNGSAWSAVAGGVSQEMVQYTGFSVSSLRFLSDGRLSVGGSFGTAGGLFSPHLAWLSSGCPASVASYGTGCTGTGGALVLSPRDLPWLGGTMRNDVSGLVPTSLVARVLGFAPLSLPLASLHPAGGVGCDLLVDPVVLDFVLPLHGATVTTSLPIPASASLIGAIVREQAIEIEVDASFAFTRINASNALFATLGAF